jgi:predicted transcriptional regulator
MPNDLEDIHSDFTIFIRELFLNQTKHSEKSPQELVTLYTELVEKFTPIFAAQGSFTEKMVNSPETADPSRPALEHSRQLVQASAPFFQQLVKKIPFLQKASIAHVQVIERLNEANIAIPENIERLGIVAVIGYKSLNAFPDHIVCLECGAEMKVMSGRHLNFHALSPSEYRTKWMIPRKELLVCAASRAIRKEATARRVQEQAAKKSETSSA